MKTLVFWGGGSAEQARRRHREGAVFLLWGGARQALEAAAIPFRTADLAPAQAEGVERAALRWTRAWVRIPLLDGRSFRELVEWKGISLADLLDDFWRTSPRLGDYVRLIETLELVLEGDAPDEVEAVGLSEDAASLLRRACTRRGILYHGPEPVPRRPGPRAAVRARTQELGVLWRSLRVSIGGGPPSFPTPERPVALFFFSGDREETELLRGLLADPQFLTVPVALGRTPRPSLEDYLGPPVRREVRAASERMRETWSRLRESPALGDAFGHRGIAFADLAQPDLAELMLVWLPRAVLGFALASAVLSALRPAVVCVGRAPGPLLLACRAGGSPVVERRGGEDAATLLLRLRAAASAPVEGP